MVCKLQLHSIHPAGTLCASDNSQIPASRLRFGAVWEGSTDAQRTSENAIFGHWTPCAEFTATVKNAGVIERLKEGKKYYVTFTEAPD
jgi:hypothetical protein